MEFLGLAALGLFLANRTHPADKQGNGKYLYNGVPNHASVLMENTKAPSMSREERYIRSHRQPMKYAVKDKNILTTLPQQRNASKDYFPFVSDKSMYFKNRPFQL